MASQYPSGLKVPVRPAPAPPPGRPTGLSLSKPPNLMNTWESFDDSFGDTLPKYGSSQPTSWPDLNNVKKKVPPPRPPPPKVSVSKPPGKHSIKQGSKSSSKQPQLLSKLFSGRGQKVELPHSTSQVGISNKAVTTNIPQVPSVATASLIDLSSPPSSPTPTTRSSSDGLSVDSFGSDGTTSHSHHHSQVESGFEDDSDLFGGFTATPSPVNLDPWASSPSTPSDVFSPVSTSTALPKIPWSTTPQDPFSPPRKFNVSPSPTPTVSLPAPAPAPGVIPFKPTIIRPKVKPNGSPSVSRAKFSASPSPNPLDDADDRSESPPMPSIPPPAPPPELFSHAESFGLEDSGNSGSKTERAHCIAMYGYNSSHPDDLAFKEGEVIELVEGGGGEWLRGRLHGREGTFPANHVNVVAPLLETSRTYATALYNFIPETWEDLELQEGAKVQILSRINNDWLYGEYNGKRGQFPSSFVDTIPSNLPMHS